MYKVLQLCIYLKGETIDRSAKGRTPTSQPLAAPKGPVRRPRAQHRRFVIHRLANLYRVKSRSSSRSLRVQYISRDCYLYLSAHTVGGRECGTIRFL